MSDYANVIPQNLEERKDDFNMKAERLIKVMEAREILDRRLEEGQHYGGIVEFKKAIIREGMPYLGNISSFGVSEEHGFWIDVTIDKDPDGLYTFTAPVVLCVGSELYFTFRELGIMDSNRREAALEQLDGKRVMVTLRREACGQFEIETIASTNVYEETFTEEDFMQPDEEE